MKIRTLIVDDEPLGRTLVRRLLARESDFEIIGECAHGAEALEVIQRDSPRLVFLDVQMPELSGFDVLASLDPDRMPVIIFVTAYDQFALKAFEAHALDYLLKPLDEDRFVQALCRAKTYLTGRQSYELQERLLGLVGDLPMRSKFLSRLAVRAGGRMIFLKAEEIDWIEAAGNYLSVHVGKEEHLLRGRVSEIEKRLNPEQFFRIHRSTIVNLDRVKEFQALFKGEGVVVLKDGSRLSASRGCSQRLQEFLETQL